MYCNVSSKRKLSDKLTFPEHLLQGFHFLPPQTVIHGSGAKEAWKKNNQSVPVLNAHLSL